MAKSAGWGRGGIDDGRAVSGRLGKGRMMGYGISLMKERGEASLKKGERCDMLAEQVSVPRKDTKDPHR